MVKEGLVTFKVVQQVERPNKKVYSITKEGQEELREWVQSAFGLPNSRHPLLVRLAWCDRLENNQIEALLNDYLGQLRRQLEVYQTDNQKQVGEFSRTEREGFLWQMILENGIRFYQSELAWAKQVLAGLEQFSDKDEMP
jgi:DNA-binding PadR family transcriptional regulator